MLTYWWELPLGCFHSCSLLSAPHRDAKGASQHCDSHVQNILMAPGSPFSKIQPPRQDVQALCDLALLTAPPHTHTLLSRRFNPSVLHLFCFSRIPYSFPLSDFHTLLNKCPCSGPPVVDTQVSGVRTLPPYATTTPPTSAVSRSPLL